MVAHARKTGGSVNISNWNLDTLEEFPMLFRVWAGQAIDEALSTLISEKLECGFAHDDPNEFIFWMPFESFEGEFDGPEFRVSLSDALNSELESGLGWGSGLDSGCQDGPDRLRSLRDHLREMADHIDTNLVAHGVPLVGAKAAGEEVTCV